MLLVMFSGGTSHAEDITVSKQDGKYFAELHPATRGYGPVVENANGFIESMELEVTWWWLLGQPVYYHTLIWQIKDSVKVENYKGYTIFLHRSELLSHPDLLKRFNQLQPQTVEITFDVKLSQMLISSKVGKFGTYFDKYGEFNYRKKIKDIELMVARSGKRGENISPGSPSFREFTGNIIKIEDGMSAQDVEERLSNTFINTGAITFRNAYISRLDLPNAEVKSIYDTMMNREHGCSKYIDNPLVWTCKEKKEDKPEKNKFAKSENDFWSNGGQSQQSNNIGSDGKIAKKRSTNQGNSQGSGFWKNGGVTGKAQGLTAQEAAKQKKDFWASGGASLEKQDSKFWQDGTDGIEAGGYEIKTVDARQGVIATSGRMLIPFREWQIHSYSGGIAEISLSETQFDSCSPPTTDDWGWSYGVTAIKRGYVDMTGEFLTPPKLLLSNDLNKFPLFHLTSTSCCLTEAEKRAGERRKAKFDSQMDDCKDDMRHSMKSVMREYRAKGYKG